MFHYINLNNQLYLMYNITCIFPSPVWNGKHNSFWKLHLGLFPFNPEEKRKACFIFLCNRYAFSLYMVTADHRRVWKKRACSLVVFYPPSLSVVGCLEKNHPKIPSQTMLVILLWNVGKAQCGTWISYDIWMNCICITY